MNDKYGPCCCGSGKKFKFCCYEKGAALGSLSEEALAERAAEFPVDRAWISRTWEESGLAQVVVVRQLPDGKSLVGAYLVDTFCLGIKNAFLQRLKPGEVEGFLDCFEEPMEEAPYEDARSVVLGAAEFAMQFGFSPDESWLAVRPIIESDRPFERKFSFGKDGKPCYIEGPHDDTASILKQLEPLISQGKAHHFDSHQLLENEFFEDDFTEDLDDDVEFEAWCDEISALLEEGQLDEAKLEIDDMLEDYAERWEPVYFKATWFMLEGDSEQAIAGFNRAITMHPSAEAYFNLANVHRSVFQLRKWVASLKKVIELDGRKGDLGTIARAELDEFAESVRKDDGISLDQFIETGEIFDRAFEHLTAGRYEDAVAGFSEVLKVRPRHVQSYANMGLAYAGLNDRRRAFECLDHAIAIDPNYQPAINNRRILAEQSSNQPLSINPMRTVDFYEESAKAGQPPIKFRQVDR